MCSRFGKATTTFAICIGLGLLLTSQARAATFAQQDVSSSLLDTIFMDDAATGGGDATVHDDSNGGTGSNFARNFDLDGNGLIGAPGLSGTVTITDFGFATSGATGANDATSVTFTFTYLGADEVIGGGDDVLIGSESVNYAHAGAGEYYVAFDTVLSASIDGLGDRFAINVNPDDNNGGLQESIRFKSAALAFETFNGAKFSASGSYVLDAISWGIDGSGNWNTANNWDPNTVPGSGGSALMGSIITAPQTVTLDVNTDLSALVFDNANSYTLTDGGGSNTLTLSGGAALTSVNGAHEIDAQILGSAGLNKAGSGTIILSGTNTYTGTNTIQGGTLAVSDNTNLGNASNGVVFDGGGTLRIDGTTMSTLPRTVTLTSNGTLNVSDPNHTVDVTSAISGSGLLVKAGEGKLSLSNAAGITGDIHVNVGTLIVDNNNGLGDTVGVTKVDAGGGTVELDGSGGSLTIAEDFVRLQGRFDGVPESHIVNTAGNNTLTGTLNASGDAFSNVRIENAAAGTTLTINNTAGDPAVLLDDTDEDLQFQFKGAGDITIGDSSTPGSGKIVGSSVNVVVAMDSPGATVTIATADNTLDSSNATGSYWGGSTTIQSGTLAVESNFTGTQGELATSSIAVRSGAMFDVSDFSSYSLQVVTDPDLSGTPNGDETGQLLTGAGTVVTDPNGSINLFEDSRLAPGDSAGTLNVTGNMSMNMTQANPNGALNFELSNGGTNDLLAVSNTLTLNQSTTGVFNLNITPIEGDLDTTAYTIMTAGTSANSGTANGSDFDITLVNPQGTVLNTRQDDTASVSINSNSVTVSFAAAQSRTWSGAVDGDWNVDDPNTAGTANWTGGDSLFQDLDSVTFGDGTGQTTVNVAETVSPGGMNFSNVSDTYTFTGSGIEGSSGMILNANSNVILANNGNAFTGDVSIAGGASLTLGDGSTSGLDTLGEDNNISINPAGTFIHNDVNGETINGVISGPGEVRNNAGTLTLGGNNTYFGPTNINGGTIVIANTDTGTPLGTVGSGTTVGLGGSLRANGETGTIFEAITLNGGTLAAGGGAASAVTFSSNVTITGDNATIRADGDTGDDGLTIAANVVGSGGNSLNVFAGNNSTVNVTGSITNNGDLTKLGTGTLALTGASSFIDAPSIDVQSGDVDVTAVSGGLALIGQTLSGAGAVTGNVSTASSSTIRVGGVAGGTPFVTAGLQLHYDAAQDTPGNATWEDLSSGGGGFVDLNFQDGGASTVVASDATLQSLTAAYDVGATGAAISPGASNGYFQGFREQQSGTFEIVFNVSNTAAGSEQVLIDIGGGRGLSLVLDGSTLKAGVNGDAATTTGLTTTLSTGWHHAVVVVGDGPAAGADDDFSLYVNNVLVDSATNIEIDDYSGDNSWGFGGSLSSNPVVIDPDDGTSQTLASPQDYHGDVALIRYYLAEFDLADVNQNYASLSASQSFVGVDTFTMSGDLTLDSSSTVEIDIFDTTIGNDVLDVTGAFNVAGTLDVDLAGTVGLGDSFDILDFDPSSISGSFSSLDLPILGGGLSWDTSALLTTGVITVISGGLAGDFNGDGRVDASDFLAWQRNPAIGSLSDWEANYGLPTTSATTNVPEPSSIVLLILCSCGALTHRRKG